MYMRNTNLGKFSIKSELLEYPGKQIFELMGRVVVVRAEYMFDRDCVEYTAISEEFDPIELGRVVPWYTVVFYPDSEKTAFVKENE